MCPCLLFACPLQLAVLVGNVGDFAVKVATAFFGSYLFLTNGLKLASTLVPPPYGPSLLAFNTFKPELSLALSSSSVDTLIGSPYIYGPAIGLVLLTIVGTAVQVRLLKAAQTSDMESLIRK